MKIFAICCISLLTLLPITTEAARVSKMSHAVTINSGSEAYQQVRVTCSSSSEHREIRKNQGATRWCVDGATDKCSSQKIRAAQLSCRTNINENSNLSRNSVEGFKAVQAPKPEVVPSHSTPTQERFSLEAELIDIKQRELDLRRQTLELQKRKLLSQN